MALLINGCAQTYAPVIDKYGADAQRGRVIRGVHVVRAGETLYSIAWRYGWDFKTLARANGIAPPYTIYPGQQIHLDRGASTASTAAVTSSPRPSRSHTARPAPTPTAPAKPAPRPVVAASGPIHWQWPVQGEVISRFSASNVGQRGISIAGQRGERINAAADGVVVYRGDGLTGYGNLLIIKHDDRWLSAYAHNKSMLVREGDTVKGGQQIATMGASGTFRTQLHFEIRRDGSPIDPLKVLPGK